MGHRSGRLCGRLAASTLADLPSGPAIVWAIVAVAMAWSAGSAQPWDAARRSRRSPARPARFARGCRSGSPLDHVVATCSPQLSGRFSHALLQVAGTAPLRAFDHARDLRGGLAAGALDFLGGRLRQGRVRPQRCQHAAAATTGLRSLICRSFFWTARGGRHFTAPPDHPPRPAGFRIGVRIPPPAPDPWPTRLPQRPRRRRRSPGPRSRRGSASACARRGSASTPTTTSRSTSSRGSCRSFSTRWRRGCSACSRAW